MKTFNIIEQKTKRLDLLYPKFKEDYMNPYLTVKQIKSKYNLTNGDYKHLRKEIMLDTGVQVKPKQYNKLGQADYPNRYIHKNQNGYVIMKNHKYYGRFANLKDARKHRDELIKNNWIEK